MFLDAHDMRRLGGRSRATAYRLFAAATKLAGDRCVTRPTGGRRGVAVPLDAAAVVLGVSEGDLAAMLAGARGEGDEAGAM